MSTRKKCSRCGKEFGPHSNVYPVYSKARKVGHYCLECHESTEKTSIAWMWIVTLIFVVLSFYIPILWIFTIWFIKDIYEHYS